MESGGQLAQYVLRTMLKKALGQQFWKAKAATTPYETSEWTDGSSFYAVRAATRSVGRRTTLSERFLPEERAMGQNYNRSLSSQLYSSVCTKSNSPRHVRCCPEGLL